MDEPKMSKKERARIEAKQKAFGYKGSKGKAKAKKRVLNDQEKHALRMEGDVGLVIRLYEELRRHDCKNKEALINQVFELQKDRLKRTACTPTFARVYQACAKHGTEKQMQLLLDSFKGEIVTMSKSPYGNQLVLALLNYARPNQREQLHEEIISNAKKLVRSRFGQRVIQHFYHSARPAVQRRVLIEVFDRSDLKAASDNYRLSLAQIFESQPVVRVACSRILVALMERCVGRGLVDAAIVQELLDVCFRFCEHEKNLDILKELRKALIHICSSKPGAQLLERCIRMGSPEDRAEILKTFEHSLEDIVTGRHSSFALCSIIDIVDDTSLVKKTILSELAKHMDTLLTDHVGSRLLMHLLTPQWARKKKAFILPPVVNHLCQDDVKNWDTLEVVESCNLKEGKPILKTITICTRPWVEKHVAALKFLLPKLQSTVSEDLAKYAREPTSRRILEELVYYATEVPSELKGDIVLEQEFLDQLKTALATVEEAVKPQKKSHIPQKRVEPTSEVGKTPTGLPTEGAQAAEPPQKKQKKERHQTPMPEGAAIPASTAKVSAPQAMQEKESSQVPKPQVDTIPTSPEAASIAPEKPKKKLLKTKKAAEGPQTEEEPPQKKHKEGSSQAPKPEVVSTTSSTAVTSAPPAKKKVLKKKKKVVAP